MGDRPAYPLIELQQPHAPLVFQAAPAAFSLQLGGGGAFLFVHNRGVAPCTVTIARDEKVDQFVAVVAVGENSLIPFATAPPRAAYADVTVAPTAGVTMALAEPDYQPAVDGVVAAYATPWDAGVLSVLNNSDLDVEVEVTSYATEGVPIPPSVESFTVPAHAEVDHVFFRVGSGAVRVQYSSVDGVWAATCVGRQRKQAA